MINSNQSEVYAMTRKWYKGDTHLHTTNSDGILKQDELINACKELGLEFMMITDHNYNTVEQSYFDGDILVIQGQELTDKSGHVNIWGKKVPMDAPYSLHTQEEYKAAIDACRDAGAVASLNHPFCSNCPFLLEKESLPFDSVEVWNTVQHSDNLKNRDWWVEQLNQGKHITAIGGSDYHRDYVKLHILAMPTTYVLAEEKTADAILKAIKEGRCVVTNSPKSSMIDLTVGDAVLGDTVKLDDNNVANIKVTNLKKGHKVIIYNNDKIIYSHTAKQHTDVFTATATIKEAGYIRAEIDYTLSPVTEKLFTLAEKIFMKTLGVEYKAKKVPDLFWAFTNPIWIE